jgi:hypothetical protein
MFVALLRHLHATFEHCLDDITLWEDQAPRWAQAISKAGAPLDTCIGFIDGTVRPIARPKGDTQRLVYSGYKKVHALKFQAVIAPNGLIVDLAGPYPGRRSDGYMLAQSHLSDRLEAMAKQLGMDLCVYGDPAYAQTRYVMRGFKGSMSHLQQIFSQRMNALRISVEWGFGKVLNDWPYLTQKMAHKLGVSPVGLVYWCAVLLSNVKCCLVAERECDGRGSATAKLFDVPPPKASTYLSASDM